MSKLVLESEENLMNFTFFKSSSKAIEMNPDGTKMRIGEEKYPWRTLPVGQSFFISYENNDVKLKTMQTSASRWSKKLKKRFRAVGHDNGIEIARLPDVDEPVIDPTAVESINKAPKVNFFDDE